MPVSVTDHPDLIENTSNFPSLGSPSNTPLTHDEAHQPSIAYVPYLLTGDCGAVSDSSNDWDDNTPRALPTKSFR